MQAFAEAAPMKLMQSFLFYGFVVRSCPIPFMYFKSVGRIFFTEHFHLPIAQDFRANGSEGDHFFFGVSADDRFLQFKMSRRFQAAIEEDERFFGILCDSMERLIEAAFYGKDDSLFIDHLF